MAEKGGQIMLVTPRATEKSYKLNADNVYVFDVPLSANKVEIAAAIEAQNKGVKVRDVRPMITKGKPKSVNRGKRARPTTAHRKDSKKAYVTVSEGKIEIAAFQEIDNQAKAEASKASQAAAAKDDGKRSQDSSKASTITRRRTGNRGDK
jgi:large subunit ribosomal protein L23